MMIDLSIPIREPSFHQLLHLLQEPGSRCGFILGEAGSGKTHLAFRALHENDSTYFYIKYDQFSRQELLPVKIIHRIPDIDTPNDEHATEDRHDWVLGQSEINYQCKKKLSAMTQSIKRNVVLVIDDIQWAGIGDISMFLDFIPNPLPENLKLLLIARDDDRYRADAIEPLLLKLKTLDKDLAVLHLSALETREAETYINEYALSRGLNVPQGFKEEIVKSAKNNPFHIKFILDAYRNNLGTPDGIYDLDTIPGLLNSTLDSELRYILFVIAQIGFCSPKSLLTNYFSFSPRILQGKLDKLVQAGILTDIDSDDAVGFTHDKVYEASKRLFKSEHLKDVNRNLFWLFHRESNLEVRERLVNRALFFIRSGQSTDAIDNGESIFIAGLSQSIDLFMHEASKEICSYLKNWSGHERLLGGKPFSLELTKLVAKSYYLQGNLGKAIDYLSSAETVFSDRISQSELLFTKSEMCFANQDVASAKRYMDQALSKVGHSSQTNRVTLSGYIVLHGIALLRSLSNEKKLQSLERVCTDEGIKQYNRCLLNAITYNYSSDPFKSGLYVSILVRNALTHGSTVETSLALMLFACGVVGGFYRDYDKAFYLADYAMYLSSKFSSRYYYVRIIFTYDCFLSFLGNRIDVTTAAMESSFEKCLKVGAIDLSSYASFLSAQLRMDANTGLQDTKNRLLSYTDRLSKLNLKITEVWCNAILQFIDDMIDGKKSAFMQGPHFDIRKLSEISDKSAHYGAYHHRGLAYMLNGNWAKARADFRRAKRLQMYAVGTYLLYLTEFYLGICEARDVGLLNFNSVQVLRLEKRIRLLKKPNVATNKTFVGKITILQGYLDYARGGHDLALDNFTKAVEISEENGHLLDRILALQALSMITNSEEVKSELIFSMNKWRGLEI